MLNYQATLHGKVTEAMDYATLEEWFRGTSAIIRNRATGVEWYADPECLAAQADRRIHEGEDPDGLVHCLSWYDPDEEAWVATGLSSSITLEQYQRGGYTEAYRTLAEVAAGCWD